MTSIQQCVICHDELTQSLSAAPCGHLFHSVCIDEWHKSGGGCPSCKIPLPKKLLRLFFECRPAGDDIGDSVTTDTKSPTGPGAIGEGGPGSANTDSAQVTELRRKLVSRDKFIEASKALSAEHLEKIKELQDDLLDTRATLIADKCELEATVKETKAKLQTTQIDLCKKHKEANRLKREMEGTGERLRKLQGDSAAHSYLSQFASKAAGVRSLNGLGQVDVEVVLGHIGRGSARADTVIRGQHEQLSAAMGREQKAKRELRKSKEENETILSELRAVKGKLLTGKKDLLHLTKELRAVQNEGRHGGGCNANPSVGSLLDAAQEKPGEKGGKKSWVLSMKSDGARVWGKEKSTRKSAPTKRGLSLAEARDADGNLRPAKRRDFAFEKKEEDLVSLGSADDGGAGSDTDTTGKGKRDAQGHKMGTCADPGSLLFRSFEFEKPLASSFLSRTFLGTAPGAPGKKREPGTFIRSGFDAMGGRHNVRNLPTNRLSLGGKNSSRSRETKRL